MVIRDADMQVRVLYIGDPGANQEQISVALASQSDFQLVKSLGKLDQLVKEVRAAEPDLIVISNQVAGQGTLDVIDDIVLQYPDVPLVAILVDNDPLTAQQVMLAGARAFIAEPFTQVNLLSTLRRVRDLEARRTKSQVQDAGPVAQSVLPLRTFAVFSPRGGVGCSMLATNLAIELRAESSESVLLVDGKLFFGHLDVMLNIRARNTIADLVPHASLLDPGLIGDVVVDHASGISVLLSPNDVQVAQGIRSDDLYNIVNGIKKAYGYVVIDAGSALTENTVTMMDAADRILLVTTPDLVALHDASRFIQISRSLGYPSDKTLIVLNRANLNGGVKTKDIETALRHELFAQVPDDSPNVLRSLNRGIPLVLQYPRSPATQSVQRIAGTLAEMGSIEAGGVQSSPSSSKKKKKSKSKVEQPVTTPAPQQVES
jgi:pilus assembly protein CpaE